MKKAGTPKREIEHYTHRTKRRVNNPPVGLVTPDTDRDGGKKSYVYDPHLDPVLQWAGKAERGSFAVPTVSLHVHERIDPRSIIEAVHRKNGEDFVQGSLFSQLEENPPLREAVEFYKHKHNWSNRLIAGDSLLVMNRCRGCGGGSPQGMNPKSQPGLTGFTRQPLGASNPRFYVGWDSVFPTGCDSMASLGGRGSCGLFGFTEALMIVAGSWP